MRIPSDVIVACLFSWQHQHKLHSRPKLRGVRMHHTSGTVESRLRTPPTRLRLRNPTGHHAISSHRQPSALDCASPPDWRSSHSTTRPPAARAAHHPAAGSTRCTPPGRRQHQSRITGQSAGQDCRLQAASRFQSGTAVRQSTSVRSAGSWLPVHARAGGQRNGCHILIPVLFTGPRSATL